MGAEGVAEVGRRRRGGCGKGRLADGFALAKARIDAAEGAGAARNIGAEDVEGADAATGEDRGLCHVDAEGQVVDVVAQIDADARGLGVDFEGGRDRDTVGIVAELRIVGHCPGEAARGQAADGVDRHALGIVLVFVEEGLDQLGAVFLAQFRDAALARPHRGQAGEVVAVELLGRANVGAADVEDVALVGVAALDPDAGQHQPLLVNVAGEGAVGGRRGKADVAQVRAADGVEGETPGDEDRGAEGEVGAVGVAEIAAVVGEAVAGVDVVAVLRRHRPGDQIDGADMDGQAEGDADRLELGVRHAAGEVHGRVEHARAPRLEEGVYHLADDGLEAPAQDHHGEKVDLRRLGIVRFRAHVSRSPSKRRRGAEVSEAGAPDIADFAHGGVGAHRLQGRLHGRTGERASAEGTA